MTGNSDNVEQNKLNAGENNTIWRVWENDGKTVKLVHVEPLNSLRLGYEGTNTETANEPDSPSKAAIGYLNSEKAINEMCSTLYSKSGYSTEIRSLTVEDIQSKLNTPFTPSVAKYAYFLDNDSKYDEASVTAGYVKIKSMTTMYNGVAVPRFYTWDKGGIVKTETVDGVTIRYAEPSEGNPVYVTPTSVGGQIGPDKTYKWNAISETETYGDLFNSTYSWLASSCVYSFSGISSFSVAEVSADGLGAYYVARSYGIADSGAMGLRPLVTLSSNVQVETNTDNIGTDAEHAWVLK